jgi:hypothetical protein
MNMTCLESNIHHESRSSTVVERQSMTIPYHSSIMVLGGEKRRRAFLASRVNTTKLWQHFNPSTIRSHSISRIGTIYQNITTIPFVLLLKWYHSGRRERYRF